MKRFAVIILAALLLAAAGCDPIPGYSNDTAGPQDGGYYDGRIGDTLHTNWFDFCVNSVSAEFEYGGYTAENGYFLIIANITVKNTFGELLPMSRDDFQVQWGGGDNDFGYGIEESEMPVEYTLRRGQSVTQDVVYEIPVYNDGEYSISYLEYYENGEYGDVFFIYFEEDMLELGALGIDTQGSGFRFLAKS